MAIEQILVIMGVLLSDFWRVLLARAVGDCFLLVTRLLSRLALDLWFEGF
jgi:hypothetical protein